MYAEALATTFKGDKEKLYKAHPQAKGFLREPRRLFGKREQALQLLDKEAKKHLTEMRETLLWE